MVDRLFADATLAALYDRMNARRRRADFDFYLPMVMTAKAVLDVGCGTGAMLKEARAAGHTGRLCGLDPAQGMIAEARARRTSNGSRVIWRRWPRTARSTSS